MPTRTLHRFTAPLAALFILTCTAAFAQKTIHVPADQATIQAGINAANTGDTVLVAPGTYFEHLDFGGKAITVVSSGGAAQTIVDGSLNGPVAVLGTTSENPAVLDGFTIQNGFPVLTPGGAASYGGGIDIMGSAVVQNNSVTGNRSCGIEIVSGNVIVRQNHVFHNTNSQTPSAEECAEVGEGILIEGTRSGTLPLTSVTLSGNLTEENESSGIYSDQTTGVSLIIGNTTRNNGKPNYTGDGGGILINYSGIHSVIANNLVYGNGGVGIYVFDGDLSTTSETLLITNNTLYSNLTIGPSNTAPGSSEIETPYGFTLVTNNIIYATATTAPPVYCNVLLSDPRPVVYDHNDVIGPASVPNTTCDLASNSNLSVNPQFRDLTNFDFHLTATSPVIDVGNNNAPSLPSIDFDGGARIQDGTGLPTAIVDLGAYEFPGQTASTLTLTSTPNPSNLGQNVHFVAQVSSAGTTPTGSVSFSSEAGLLGTQSLSGSGGASLDTATLPAGTHTITALYVSSGNLNSSSAALTQVVDDGYATSITLSGSPNPSITGQNVTFTAAVTSTNGNPTGSVQFTDNGTAIGTQALNASGVAALSTSTLSVGSHNITATYTPTGSFAGSSTSITQTVNDVTFTINITSSLNPSTYGQPVTITLYTAQSGGVVAPGSATFSDGGQLLGTQRVDASGNAAITLSTLSVGAHIITGAFFPDGSSHTFGISLTQQVNGLATSTLLTATPTTGVAHITAITLTATVAPAASGNPTPAGQVLFYLNGAQLNLATLVKGVATYTGILPAGTNQIYAAYVGDPNRIYDSSNSNTITVTITAAPSTLSLSSSLNPAPALTPFTLSAQLGIPGSSQTAAGYPITFTIAPAITGQATTNASGTATYTGAGLLPSQYLVTATFAGTTDLQPSTATFLETVLPNPTATTLTASPNPGIQGNPVTFTSTVSALAGAASPSGSVTIYDALSPNPPLNPIATLTLPAGSTTVTFTTSTLAPGTHILYAAFTPTAAFAPSQSAQFTLVIEPQSFTLTLSEPNLSLQTGHHHTETASLTSIGGLTGTFTLSCATLPQYASCAWTQGSVTLPANGTVSTSLTIDTDQLLDFVASNVRPAAKPSDSFATRLMQHEWAATAAFTLFPLTLLGFRRRRSLRSLLPLLILAALAATITACGASQYPYSTTPGTYTVLVTAAGPPGPGRPLLTQTVVLTLVVTR